MARLRSCTFKSPDEIGSRLRDSNTRPPQTVKFWVTPVLFTKDHRMIKLHGIDAPERNQTCGTDPNRWDCGRQSSRALSEMIDRTPVTCHVSSPHVLGHS